MRPVPLIEKGRGHFIMGIGLFVFFIIILIFIGMAVTFSGSANDDNPLLDYNGNDVSVARMGALGTHMHGLGIGEQITLCVITETDFLFAVVSPEKKTIDQFPFKNLKAIEIQDATQLSKRLTATRLALLANSARCSHSGCPSRSHSRAKMRSFAAPSVT